MFIENNGPTVKHHNIKRSKHMDGFDNRKKIILTILLFIVCILIIFVCIKYSYIKQQYSKNLLKYLENTSNLSGMPVNSGKIIRSFGFYNNIRLNKIQFNPGVIISAKKDCLIKSTTSGRVIGIVHDPEKIVNNTLFSNNNNFPLYGNTIIVLEDKGVFAIKITGLKNILVIKGDYIRRGQPIGKLDENRAKQSYLAYFITFNGREVSPENFINNFKFNLWKMSL